MTRHEQRYKAMTILYQAFLYNNNKIEYNIDDIISEQIDEENKFINSLVKGVLENNDKLNNIANKYLDNWDINRLGYTDQAILKMAIYELLNMDTPPVSCIDEAIELAKEYSDDGVVKMINATLDKIYHNKDNNE